mmetsp:Transcript_27915/g.53131  ORF Transcript_27915/g.53131 Transcript_27915/m.53131 type:complete len:311 (+) Transcript_27915:764-1696(+)
MELCTKTPSGFCLWEIDVLYHQVHGHLVPIPVLVFVRNVVRMQPYLKDFQPTMKLSASNNHHSRINLHVFRFGPPRQRHVPVLLKHKHEAFHHQDVRVQNHKVLRRVLLHLNIEECNCRLHLCTAEFVSIHICTKDFHVFPQAMRESERRARVRHHHEAAGWVGVPRGGEHGLQRRGGCAPTRSRARLRRHERAPEVAHLHMVRHKHKPCALFEAGGPQRAVRHQARARAGGGVLLPHRLRQLTQPKLLHVGGAVQLLEPQVVAAHRRRLDHVHLLLFSVLRLTKLFLQKVVHVVAWRWRDEVIHMYIFC